MPALVYVCDGLFSDEIAPSPNFQELFCNPVLVLVKLTAKGEQPAEAAVVNDATGFGFTVTVFTIKSLHPSEVVTTNVTE